MKAFQVSFATNFSTIIAKPGPSPFKLRRSVASITSMLVALLLTFAPPARTEERLGSEIERIYVFLASDLLERAFCQKISPDSYEAASWAVPRGYQTAYLRSKCLFNLAVRAKHPAFCEQVVERKSFWFDGSSISSESCREWIRSGRTVDNSTGDLELLLRLLGEPGGKDSVTTYYRLRELPAFRKRLSDLPDFSEPNLATISALIDSRCQGRRTGSWFCITLRCLMITTETCRNDCLHLANERRYDSALSRRSSLAIKNCPDVARILAAGATPSEKP